MADSSVKITVSVRDLATLKLLLLQLTWLRDALIVEANPAAERLDKIIESFHRPMTDGGEMDGDPS